LQATEFGEIYPLINEKPFEIVNNSAIILSHIKNFMDISEETIKNLRKYYRPDITNEQKKIWTENLKFTGKRDHETISSKRIKFLGKFPLLDYHVRITCWDELDSMEKINLDLLNYKCLNNPLWLYDFTLRSKTCNFLCYKVGKPVKIYEEYFGSDNNKSKKSNKSQRCIFTPESMKNNTEDYKTDYNKIVMKNPKVHNSPIQPLIKYDDSLLLCRESHICWRDEFKHEFQKLFNHNSPLLYTNWTIYNFYGDEKESETFKEVLVKNILALSDFDKMEDDYKENNRRRGALTVNSKSAEVGSRQDEFDIEEFIKEKEDMAQEGSKTDEVLLKFLNLNRMNRQVHFDNEGSMSRSSRGVDLLQSIDNRGEDNMLRTTMSMLRTSWAIHPE